MSEIIFRILILFFALGGFFLASYIRRKKQSHNKLTCPLGHDCDSVIHSKYSKFLGIPVENLGILYYVIVAVSYGLSFIFLNFLSLQVVSVVLGLTIIAFFFSLYLTAIQAFILRQWCTWCLISAGLCTVIFITAWLIK